MGLKPCMFCFWRKSQLNRKLSSNLPMNAYYSSRYCHLQRKIVRYHEKRTVAIVAVALYSSIAGLPAVDYRSDCGGRGLAVPQRWVETTQRKNFVRVTCWECDCKVDISEQFVGRIYWLGRLFQFFLRIHFPNPLTWTKKIEMSCS